MAAAGETEELEAAAGAPCATWRTKHRQVIREEAATIARVLGEKTTLSKVKRLSFASTVRSLRPYTLEHEPNEAQLIAFRLWMWAYPSRQWRATARELRRAQPELLTHPALQTFLEELPLNPAWDAVRSAVVKTEAHHDFGSSLDRLSTLSGQRDIASCGDVSPEAAHDYCWEQNGNIALADLRFAILQGTGFRHAEAIRERLATTRRLASAFRARGVQVQTHGGKGESGNRFADYVFLHDAFGGILPDVVVQTWEPAAVVEIFDAMDLGTLTPSKVFNVFSHVARAHGKHELAEAVKHRVHPRFTDVSCFDWLLGLSAWHGEALPRILDGYHEAHDKTHFSSAYRLEQKQWVGRCLMFMHDYVARGRRDGKLAPSDASPLEWLVHCCSLQLAHAIVKDFLASRQTDNSRVKAARPIHSCSVDAYKLISLFQQGVQPLVGDRIDFSQLSAKKVLKQTKNERTDDVPDPRRTFTEDEMNRMFAVVESDARWTLMLTLLREIGLRRTALAHIRYKMLVMDTHTPRHACKIPEKGKTWRVFVTSGRLRGRIKAYSDQLRAGGRDISPDAYLFNLRDPSAPLASGTIYEGLRGIADAAAITDVQVHPHAFRHTIVGELLEAGNSIEVTAKYMGHARVETTATSYWVPRVMDLHAQMNNPFTGTFQRRVEAVDEVREQLDETRTKLDAALRLLCQQTSVFRAAASQGMTAEQAVTHFAQQVPQAEDVFRCIVEPTCASASDAAAEQLAQELNWEPAGLTKEDLQDDASDLPDSSLASTQTPWTCHRGVHGGSTGSASDCSIRPEDSASNLSARPRSSIVAGCTCGATQQAPGSQPGEARTGALLQTITVGEVPPEAPNAKKRRKR